MDKVTERDEILLSLKLLKGLSKQVGHDGQDFLWRLIKRFERRLAELKRLEAPRGEVMEERVKALVVEAPRKAPVRAPLSSKAYEILFDAITRDNK